MKKSIFKLLVLLIIVSSPGIGVSNSYFVDQGSVTGNTVSAGWWVPPTVTVISPNGGEIWVAGSTHDITWTAASSDPTATVTINLYYSTDSGGSYPNTIATGLTNTGSYPWTLPGVKFTTMRVKVVAADSHGLVGEDISDADFDPAEEEEKVIEEEKGLDNQDESQLEEPAKESSEVMPEDEVVTEEVDEPTTGQSEEQQGEENKEQAVENQDVKQEEEQTVENEDNSENSDGQDQPPADEPQEEPQVEEPPQNQTPLPGGGVEIDE